VVAVSFRVSHQAVLILLAPVVTMLVITILKMTKVKVAFVHQARNVIVIRWFVALAV
tara:strand:+ start:247 stop:417 length:171 start_codon:yes stop_codon:yes gene_type:complete